MPAGVSRSTEAVLRVLLDAPKDGPGLYGAEISRLASVGNGSLYPALDGLEDAGWIEGIWEEGDPAKMSRPRRRYYRLTGLGAVEAERVIADALRRLAPKGWQPAPGWSQ